MNRRKLTYPHEKFLNAASTLAASSAPLAKRIEYAFSSFFGMQTKVFDGFPELKAKYDKLSELLTAHKDETETEGHVPKTLRLSSEDELCEIAALIFDIYDDICRIYYAEG